MANPTETKKSGARFNVFDVIIILALLACIAAIVIRAYFTANIENDFTTAKIEFTVKEVSDYTAEALKENTTLYLAAGDDEIGTVDTVTYSPAELYAEDASGVLVPASHPDKKDVRGTATLYGIWTDDGFMIPLEKRSMSIHRMWPVRLPLPPLSDRNRDFSKIWLDIITFLKKPIDFIEHC